MTLMIRALIWEVIYKSRIGLTIGLLIVPLVWFLLEAYLKQVIGDVIPIGKVSFAIMLLAVLFLYTTFSYVDTNSTAKTNEGFPTHILRLPLPTWVLSVVPILLGNVVVASFILLWINIFSDLELSWLMQFTICSVAGAFISWSQAINWGLNTPMIQKVVLLLSVIAGLVFSVIAIFDIDERSSAYSKLYGSLGLIILLISGYFFCFITLLRTRRSDNFQFRLEFSFLNRFKLFSNSKKLANFSNGLSAQYWYEWKSLAFAIPLAIALISVIELGAAIFGAERRIILAGVMMMSTVFLMSAHFMACNKLGSEKFNILPHCATRPLSDFDLAISKLNMLAFSVAIAYLFFAFVPILSIYIIGLPEQSASSASNEIIETVSIVKMLSMFALAFIAFFAIFWAASANGCAILLRDSKLMFALNIAGFLSLGAIFLGSIIYFKAQPGSLEDALKASAVYQLLANNPHLAPLTLTVLISILMASLLAPFKRVARLQQLKNYFLICSTGLVISLGLVWVLELPFKASAFASYSLVNLFLLCLLPFIVAPINVAKNRHR